MSKQKTEKKQNLLEKEELRLISIDRNFKGFVMRHKKSILNSTISLIIGVLCAFFWLYVLIGIMGFVIGYSFRYYYVFKKSSDEEHEKLNHE